MPKSLIAQRREQGATCSICQSPDYTQYPPHHLGGKLNYICDSCGRWWQCGIDGGIYGKLAKEVTVEKAEKPT